MPPDSDPEGKRLPIKLDSTSNGEFTPMPLDAVNRRAHTDLMLASKVYGILMTLTRQSGRIT